MPANRTKVGPVQAPSEATHWALYQAFADSKRNRGTRYARCKWPEPQNDGTVLELFPVQEYSPPLILQTWGPGKYRIDWFDASGTLLKGQSRTFTVANPRENEKLKRTHRRRTSEPQDDDAGDDAAPTIAGMRVGSDGRVGLIEVFAMITEARQEAAERADRAAALAREESQRAAERDRQFFAQIMGMQRGGGAADVSTIVREMNLQIREQMLGIREELGLQRREEDEEPDPPANLDDALEQIGLGALSEIEQRAPGFIKENAPKFLEWVKDQANGAIRANRG